MQTDSSAWLPNGERFISWEGTPVFTREIHVAAQSPDADDANDGSLERPLATINAAAQRATAGTRVLIHGGTYRECVRPAHSGTGPESLVSFESYGDDEVIIKASEVARDFELSSGWRTGERPDSLAPASLRIWHTRLDPELFRGYNPFCAVNVLHDRLFLEYDKTDMTTYLNRRGMVFCDGRPLHQVQLYRQLAERPGSYWVEANGQTVHFRLPGDADPQDHLIELTCREQCIAPDVPFLSYIRLRGLICAHAATGTPVPQRGAISAYRGHHWLIEDCTIDWSNGVGIDIGNECWHHSYDPEQVLGHTIIRRCTIRDVGVCAIAAMFVEGILIEDNLIQGTGWQRMELSWEAGGLKAHNCRDSLFRRNIFRDTIRADHLWLDVDNRNNRITGNLFLNGIEQREAIFIEYSRDGVNLIDNNIFWGIEGRFDPAAIAEEPGSSGWYKLEDTSPVNGYAVYGEGTDHLRIAHNLIAHCRADGYFAKAVAFRINHGGRGGTARDAELVNNLFYDCGRSAFRLPNDKNRSDGNGFFNMPGGYLRVQHPAPEVCLDLGAWQAFYGQDRQSCVGMLRLNLDLDDYSLVVEPWDEPLPTWPGQAHEDWVLEPQAMPRVAPYGLVAGDFFGRDVSDETRLPGPFAALEPGQRIAIDPRRRA